MRAFAPLALLLAGSTAVTAAVLHPEPAEEIHYDALGNMVWRHAAQSAAAVQELQRPDFSHIDLSESAKEEWDLLVAHADHAASDAADTLTGEVSSLLNKVTKLLKDGEHKVEDLLHNSAPANAIEGWLHAGKVFIDGIHYERLVHSAFPDYALRITSDPAARPAGSKSQYCADSAYSVSGYLDIRSTAHLFFTFHESRSKPASDPLTLWLNGGPGCSSMTGALFENGPCSITSPNSTEVNEHSWNSNSNVIFLDQPVSGVGFSYADDGETDVNNTPAAAKDVYAFLQLFLAKFPKYSKAPFHVSGESYAGFYIPNIGNYIWKQNKALRSASGKDSRQRINLSSLLIGNGLSDPLIQFPSVYDWACSPSNPYHLFDEQSATCQGLKGKASTCESMIKSCQKYNSKFVCTPAALYCWSSMYNPLQQTGLNLYDVRKTCDRSPDADGPLCYKQMEWIETFLNQAHIKSELGVPSSVDFVSCNTAINQKFLFNADSMHSAAALLPEMLDDSQPEADRVRVLIYNGLADAMCNSIGDERWVEALNSTYTAEYAKAEERSWKVDGKEKGTVRAAGTGGKSKAKAQKFGDIAFVKVFEAGHMVPYNQPAASLDLFNKWIANEPLN